MLLRHVWWLRLDGRDHSGSAATWELEGWPPLRFEREALFTQEGS